MIIPNSTVVGVPHPQQLMSGQFTSGLSIPDYLRQAGCTFAINVDRQVGSFTNPNTAPFINPLVDVVGKLGKNLFDGLTAIDGLYFASNGALVSNASSFYSPNYLPVSEGMQLVPNNLNGSVQIVEYDANKNFIRRTNVVGYYTIQAGTSFARVSFFSTDKTRATAQLEPGTVATTYEPYGFNNVLLQSFAGTTADGYTQIATKANSGDLVDYTNLLGNQNTDNSLLNVASGIGVFLSTNGGVSASADALQTVLSANKRYVVITQFRDATVASNINILRNFAQDTVLGTPVVFDKKLVTLVNIGATPAVGLAYRNNVAGSNYYHDWSMLINLTDNITVQALEAKLGRQLTVAECDQIFSFVPSTGQVFVKTPWFIECDGTNSFGILPNVPDLDPTGDDDFAIGVVFKSPATWNTGYLYSASEGSSVKFGLIFGADTSIYLSLNGTWINIATAKLAQNSIFKLFVIRKNGVLKCVFNNIQTYSSANSDILVAGPIKRMFSRSGNADGTVSDTFCKGSACSFVFAKGAKGTLDETKLSKALDKLNANYI